jgi:hypothetical protein
MNDARSFGVRATFPHNGHRLDAFASIVVNPVDGTFDHHTSGNNFHGLYSGIEKLAPKGVIEPYVLWRLQQRQAGFRRACLFRRSAQLHHLKKAIQSP